MPFLMQVAFAGLAAAIFGGLILGLIVSIVQGFTEEFLEGQQIALGSATTIAGSVSGRTSKRPRSSNHRRSGSETSTSTGMTPIKMSSELFRASGVSRPTRQMLIFYWPTTSSFFSGAHGAHRKLSGRISMSSSSKNMAVSIAAIGAAMSLLTYVFLVIYDGPDKFVPSVFVGALSAAICLKIVDYMARRAARTARDRGIPAQPTVKPHVVLRLDGTQQLDTMLAARKQSGDTVGPAIEAAVAAGAIARATSGPRTVSFVIFKVPPTTTTDDVLRGMSRQGVRPATIIELIAFMKLMADLNLTAHFPPIVALGEFDVNQSPMVVSLEFEPFFKSIDSLQGAEAAFLAVIE